MVLGFRKKITNYQFSTPFFSLLTDIHLIFGTVAGCIKGNLYCLARELAF
jgi:hypothetical protein